MSLPTRADVSVNCVPASCMPSPESPAKRMVTDGSAWIGLPFPPPLPVPVLLLGCWTSDRSVVNSMMFSFPILDSHSRQIAWPPNCRQRRRESKTGKPLCPFPRRLGELRRGRQVVDPGREVLDQVAHDVLDRQHTQRLAPVADDRQVAVSARPSSRRRRARCCFDGRLGPGRHQHFDRLGDVRAGGDHAVEEVALGEDPGEAGVAVGTSITSAKPVRHPTMAFTTSRTESRRRHAAHVPQPQ